jgi:hypothetical protein
MSRLVAAPPPNRVRSPTDRQFASGCSPPRLTATQLPSATELWHTPARTFTVLMWRPHGRTHSRKFKRVRHKALDGSVLRRKSRRIRTWTANRSHRRDLQRYSSTQSTIRTPAGQKTSTTVSPTARGVCAECGSRKTRSPFSYSPVSSAILPLRTR